MERIQDYIVKVKATNSEDLLDITSQPDNLCPKIDAIKESIFSAVRNSLGYCKDIKQTEEIQDAYSLSDDIVWEIENIDYNKELESLRKEIEQLRSWGNDWKNLAKKLIESKDKVAIEDLLADKYYINLI